MGPLQPILAEMPRILRRVAVGELELEQARKMLEEAAKKETPPVVDAFENVGGEIEPDVSAEQSAVKNAVKPATQEQLAAFCLAHPAPGMIVSAAPEPGEKTVTSDGLPGCLSINWPDVPPQTGISPAESIAATFDGRMADKHPPTAPVRDAEGNLVEGGEGVRLLTWGDPYLEAWLETICGRLSDENGEPMEK